MGGGSGEKDSAGRMQYGGSWRKADQWPVPAPSSPPTTCAPMAP